MLLYYSQEWFDYNKTLTSYVMNGMETDLQSLSKSFRKKKKKKEKKKKKAPPNLKFKYAGLAGKIILLKLLSNSLYYQSNWLSVYNWIQSSVILWADNISSDKIEEYSLAGKHL